MSASVLCWLILHHACVYSRYAETGVTKVGHLCMVACQRKCIMCPQFHIDWDVQLNILLCRWFLSSTQALLLGQVQSTILVNRVLLKGSEICLVGIDSASQFHWIQIKFYCVFPSRLNYVISKLEGTCLLLIFLIVDFILVDSVLL